MRHIVPLIWEAIRTDANNAIPIDVASYYRKFGTQRQELNYEEFRKIMLDAVSDVQGAVLRLE